MYYVMTMIKMGMNFKEERGIWEGLERRGGNNVIIVSKIKLIKKITRRRATTKFVGLCVMYL